ncbi:hypothetical protein LINPERHAP2_LOCUS7574 [Linum perenne]
MPIWLRRSSVGAKLLASSRSNGTRLSLSGTPSSREKLSEWALSPLLRSSRPISSLKPPFSTRGEFRSPSLLYDFARIPFVFMSVIRVRATFN